MTYFIGWFFTFSHTAHCFRVRETSEDDKSVRTYFTIPPVMSPYKCSVLRLLGKPEFDPVMKAVSVGLKKSGLQHKVDDVRGISIGKGTLELMKSLFHMELRLMLIV